LTNERNKVKADILTYNGLILGLCKEGKTKKAAILGEMFFEPVVRKAQLYPMILKEIYNVCAYKLYNHKRDLQLSVIAIRY
jgi:hypothetical protein